MATKADEHEARASTTSGAASQPKAQPAAATTRTPEQREAMAAATIGAQIILDYNGDGSIARRGGGGRHDQGRHDGPRRAPDRRGLDPKRPVRPAHRRAVEPPAAAYARHLAARPAATRMSSLAAGIIDRRPATTPSRRLRTRSADERRGGDVTH